ncbi:MAG: DUF1207 domain-containing protein [Ignavibacteria bacterium]|nr:DUF1207 domain-containing protein [Ignavibacteria bacterium]
MITSGTEEADRTSYRSLLLIAFISLLTVWNPCSASAGSDSVFFFSSEKVYTPLEAGVLESRIGFQKYTNSKFLELDIGASADIAGVKSGNSIYSAGIDFFTFSNLRSESNFKFPVDAIDYYFGINLNLKNRLSKRSDIQARLRAGHISSHLEDGHIYENTDTIFTPFVFSKEFIDLSAIYEYRPGSKFLLKGQGGINFIFHSIPAEISPFSGQIGFEARYLIADVLSLYASNEVTIAEVNSSVNLNESFEGGVRLGRLNSRGITIFFSYYDGQDFRGQYYGEYLNTLGIGLKFNY